MYFNKKNQKHQNPIDDEWEYGIIEETAVYLTNRGYRLLPLGGIYLFDKQGNSLYKHPLQKGWVQRATSDINQLKAYMNESVFRLIWGVATSNFLVIDVDGEKGNREFHQIQKSLNIACKPTVKTPRGGYHYYFKAPSNHAQIKGRGGLVFNGQTTSIDIRAAGNMVVAPFMQGRNEKGDHLTYRLLSDDLPCPNDLPDIPRPLLDLLPKRTMETVKAVKEMEVKEITKPITFDDEPSPIVQKELNALKGYASTLADVAESLEGSAKTLKAITWALRRGLPHSIALEVIERWNQSLLVPWGADELNHKIQSSFEYIRR